MSCSIRVKDLRPLLHKLQEKIEKRRKIAAEEKEAYIKAAMQRRSFPCFWRMTTEKEALALWQDDGRYAWSSHVPYRWTDLESMLKTAISLGLDELEVTEKYMDVLDF